MYKNIFLFFFVFAQKKQNFFLFFAKNENTKNMTTITVNNKELKNQTSLDSKLGKKLHINVVVKLRLKLLMENLD